MENAIFNAEKMCTFVKGFTMSKEMIDKEIQNVCER